MPSHASPWPWEVSLLQTLCHFLPLPGTPLYSNVPCQAQAPPACPAVIRDTHPTPCLLPKAAIRGQDTPVTGVTGWGWPASSPHPWGAMWEGALSTVKTVGYLPAARIKKVSAENIQIPTFLGFDHICRGTAKTSHKTGTSSSFPCH